jgi:outer membrane protein assembly factor BamE (lipoprotein component of BamABCDE complex)
MTLRGGASFFGMTMGLALLSGGLSLSGCFESDPKVTIGREFAIERMVAVQKGKSSKRQVEDLLGKAYKVEKLGSRKERWRYYSREEVVERVLGLIPNKTYVTVHEVYITFDGTLVEGVAKESNSYIE